MIAPASDDRRASLTKAVLTVTLGSDTIRNSERLDYPPNREVFMGMMTPASHQFVDLQLREAAEAMEKSQSATAVKKGYVNFEMDAGDAATSVQAEMRSIKAIVEKLPDSSPCEG